MRVSSIPAARWSTYINAKESQSPRTVFLSLRSASCLALYASPTSAHVFLHTPGRSSEPSQHSGSSRPPTVQPHSAQRKKSGNTHRTVRRAPASWGRTRRGARRFGSRTACPGRHRYLARARTGQRTEHLTYARADQVRRCRRSSRSSRRSPPSIGSPSTRPGTSTFRRPEAHTSRAGAGGRRASSRRPQAQTRAAARVSTVSSFGQASSGSGRGRRVLHGPFGARTHPRTRGERGDCRIGTAVAPA